MKCMNACPDHPFFTVCKFDCTRTRLTCLANCKACDGTIIIPHLGAPVVKPGPKARSENEADFFTGYIPYPHSHSHESEQQEQQEQEQEQEQEEEKPKGLQAAEDAATIYNRFN
ncbi:hypothetical protein TARUN_10149 [Trichoderma arundinaceum]|uniref:Uncharacterized protein n=1 Tax=Trichoderma arundinaceum TaxID=490622 RepID=A0A395N8V6_TRIAR|nr:hypothetical protein TARUN_10149 [Trichoderma arundinaceum]